MIEPVLNKCILGKGGLRRRGLGISVCNNNLPNHIVIVAFENYHENLFGMSSVPRLMMTASREASSTVHTASSRYIL